ncbi:hypothetical protein SmJEL517_g03994 [Synchytrium microbalum]|uniref:B30.2/SPRY domain-containing protein n=1 Tax=Synchytrium microbalum TaxID=1806994 RepID=A0A507C0M6_9FUNG|nr:uncharacterized protein SmJEL517_g03994 [Synchytrium microbalum]TPX32961.1 hypothetical protein SmJEL517_g03994 [Synchytrium microbalum]
MRKSQQSTILRLLVLIFLATCVSALPKGGGGSARGGGGSSSGGGSTSGGGGGSSSGGSTSAGSGGSSYPYYYPVGCFGCYNGVGGSSYLGGIAWYFWFLIILVIAIAICCCITRRKPVWNRPQRPAFNTSGFVGKTRIASMFGASGRTVYGNKPSWQMDVPEAPPGSFYASFNNTTEAAFLAGVRFEKDHPPPPSGPVPNHTIVELKRVGMRDAWQFMPEAGSGINVNLSRITFNVQGDRSVLSRLPLYYRPKGEEVPFYYYEVTIAELQYAPTTTVVSVGLATSLYPSFRLVGWNKHSVGYHSDDGRRFVDDPYGGKDFGPPFTKGDTIGCGYDHSRMTIFFTKNGEMIGDCVGNVLYPYHMALGADGPCVLDVNFEGPFKFAPANGTSGEDVIVPTAPPQYDGVDSSLV